MHRQKENRRQQITCVLTPVQPHPPWYPLCHMSQNFPEAPGSEARLLRPQVTPLPSLLLLLGEPFLSCSPSAPGVTLAIDSAGPRPRTGRSQTATESVDLDSANRGTIIISTATVLVCFGYVQQTRGGGFRV